MKIPLSKAGDLIEHLKARAANYCWHGWRHVRYGSPMYKREPGDEIHTIGVRTVSPQTLIEISIRLFYAAEWKEHRHDPCFDPEKHFFWFKITIIDPFGRKGVKNLCAIVCDKEEEGIERVLELFQTIRAIAVFHEAEKMASALGALDEALRLL